MVLLNSWSITKIQLQLKVSNYTIQTSKKLMAEKGIKSNPNVNPDKVLPPATNETLKQFYMYDEISRITPGTIDYVSLLKRQEGSYSQTNDTV
jgi:DNA modification methylase